MNSGWKLARLGDLGTWRGGGTPSKSTRKYWDAGSIPWLSPKDMTRDVLAGTQDHITATALAESTTKLIPKGSVAVVVRSGILERKIPVAVVPFETTLNQDMKAVIPGPGVDARWIAWGIRAAERQILTSCRKAGTTVASLNVPALYDFQLLVPALPVQRGIVEILEEHFSRLNAAERDLESALKRTNNLERQTIVSSLTGAREDGARSVAPPPAGTDDRDLPPISAEWEWRRLGDVADVVGGVTKDTKKQSDATVPEVPYLRVANVQRGHLDLSIVATIRVSQAKAALLTLQAGDVLFNEGGDRDKLGRGWVWEGQIPGCIHQNHVFRARVRRDTIDPYLLSWAGNSIGGRWCERNGIQSVNLASISLSKIRLMPIPVPPRRLQAEIRGRIERAVEELRALREAIEASRRRSSALRRSLLAAAFSGRLTGRSSDMDVVEELAGV